MANNIVAALKKLFSLAGDPQTIAEALDEAELSGGGGLPDVTAADKNKGLLVNTSGVWATDATVVATGGGAATASACTEGGIPVYDSVLGTYKRITGNILPQKGNGIKGKLPAGDSSGNWVLVDAALLPAVTAADNGKVLKVVDGNWAVSNA